METEATAARATRPRPLLLILLGVAVLALLVVKLMPSGSATQGQPTSNQRRPAATAGKAERVDPQELDVRLEALNAPRPEPSGTRRNPFGFQPKPPPSAPPSADNGPGESVTAAPQPYGDPGPQQPAQIPLKFIGIIEGQGKKLAALTDCNFTYGGEEGEVIDGRYRLVRIGVESVVMEYVDGRGRTTIRLSGQDCVGR